MKKRAVFVPQTVEELAIDLLLENFRDISSGSGSNTFDLDWAATIRGITSDGGELVFPKYAIGKTYWSIIKAIGYGETSGNPIPFTDEREKHAVEWAMGGGAFKDLFTDDFMRTECPNLYK